MKPENAAAILKVADVNGGLVGGASLKAADFLAIVRAASGERLKASKRRAGSCRRRRQGKNS